MFLPSLLLRGATSDAGHPPRSGALVAIVIATGVALGLGLSAPTPAVAQAFDLPDPVEPTPEPEPESAFEPDPDLSREERIELALEALQSEDEAERARAESRLSDLWSDSGSDSMNLLLKRGRDAMEREAFDAALEHFTDLVNLAPEFAEGWNARATVHYRLDKYGAALADLSEALALEARHFSALAGLGVILEAVGDEAGAVAAFRQALTIHPHLDGPQEAVDRLAPKVDGRDA